MRLPEGILMLNRLTINTLLKAVIATLGAAVVIMLSLSAWNSWERLGSASRALAVADASSYLFTALHHLRSTGRCRAPSCLPTGRPQR
jgi:hypothetical protein